MLMIRVVVMMERMVIVLTLAMKPLPGFQVLDIRAGLIFYN